MTRSLSSNFTAKVNVWSLLSAGRLLGAEIIASEVLNGADTQIAAPLVVVKERYAQVPYTIALLCEEQESHSNPNMQGHALTFA